MIPALSDLDLLIRKHFCTYEDSLVSLLECSMLHLLQSGLLPLLCYVLHWCWYLVFSLTHLVQLCEHRS